MRELGDEVDQAVVCAENLVLVDSVTESHNHPCDGCAAILVPQSFDFAFQVDEAAWRRRMLRFDSCMYRKPHPD
jgi:hypothetical protein